MDEEFKKHIPLIAIRSNLTAATLVASHYIMIERQKQLAKAYTDLEKAYEEYKERVYKKQHPIKYFFKKLFNKLKGKA